MSQWITLDTPHGPVRTWQAASAQHTRGAVVVVQEIFGVNAHIREVASRFAQAGFTALAPSMFDPVQPGVELRHDEDGLQRGRRYATDLGVDAAIDILRVAGRRLRESNHVVGCVGFCWGGSMAYLTNTRLAMPAVSYYGARTVPFLREALRAPMLFHFGADDPMIPVEDIDAHRCAHPDAAVHVYDGAGHAFNRDIDPHHYQPAAADLAWTRTLAFLQAHLQ